MKKTDLLLPLKKKKKATWKKKVKKLILTKLKKNPILGPIKDHSWEAWQTFNPGAFLAKGKTHLVYRAIGKDGASRLGYARSKNGIDIEYRENTPVYSVLNVEDQVKTSSIPNFPVPFSSGGLWIGCEDPRITKIDNTLHMIYVAFDGFSCPRLALTSIKLKDFMKRRWFWKKPKFISPPGIIDKSGCLFPEKINDRYVILHRVFPNILVDFVDNLEFANDSFLKGQYAIKIRKNGWDSLKIGAGAPPIKTNYGWLLIYYGVDARYAFQYNVGAMILDSKNPSRVLYRADEPILQPDQWYENEGHKPGIAYPCGAVVTKGRLFVYYGGADTVVCAAYAGFDTFVDQLIKTGRPKLEHARKSKVMFAS